MDQAQQKKRKVEDVFVPKVQQILSGLEFSTLQILDMPKCQLTCLPDEVTLMPNLVKLNLPFNQLDSLPQSLVSCTKLKILFLLANRFRTVPSVIGQMQSLEMLSLKANVVETIEPEALTSNMVWLILSDNRIAEVPSTIGRCTGLRKLMLAGNCVKTLPAEIEQCTSLELVRLADNQLESPPVGLLSLYARYDSTYPLVHVCAQRARAHTPRSAASATDFNRPVIPSSAPPPEQSKACLGRLLVQPVPRRRRQRARHGAHFRLLRPHRRCRHRRARPYPRAR
jgi:hypothetical protein